MLLSDPDNEVLIGKSDFQAPPIQSFPGDNDVYEHSQNTLRVDRAGDTDPTGQATAWIVHSADPRCYDVMTNYHVAYATTLPFANQVYRFLAATTGAATPLTGLSEVQHRYHRALERCGSAAWQMSTASQHLLIGGQQPSAEAGRWSTVTRKRAHVWRMAARTTALARAAATSSATTVDRWTQVDRSADRRGDDS